MQPEKPIADYARPPSPAEAPISIGSILIAFVSCCVGGGVAGAIIGLLLGIFAPDFYRFGPGGGGPQADPVQVGVGLGISEGLGLGFLLAAVIVIVRALARRRQP